VVVDLHSAVHEPRACRGRLLDGRDTLDAELGACGDGGPQHPLVELRTRHHPAWRIDDRGLRRAAGRDQPHPADLLPGFGRGNAQPVEFHERVRCDAVAAHLVAPDRLAVEDEHPRIGSLAQSRDGGRRSRGAGSDDDQVPVGHVSDVSPRRAVGRAPRRGR
jgi:hypothetical protein